MCDQDPDKADLKITGTVGHPLADLTNLMQPWTISNTTPDWPRIHADPAFVDPSQPNSKNSEYPGLPTREQAIQWYCETAAFDIPDKDLTWASSFALFRDSIIFQGIAARYAVRQATSEKARSYGAEMAPFASMAWDVVKKIKNSDHEKAKM